MEIRRELVAPCTPDRLADWTGDLAVYPQWMHLVHDVQGDGDDAWIVELQAQIGPFTRSKRLRMVRTEWEPPATAVFERDERDGREHSPWVLRVDIEPVAAEPSPTTRLTMTLRYGGGLWTGAVLQRVLDDAVRRGSDALVELVSAPPTR